MDLDVTLKNYRCFSNETPARFTVRRGITAFVGPNNAGKSTVLRFFYEFRDLFQRLPNDLPAAAGENRATFSVALPDLSELFTKSNPRDLVIEMAPRGEAGLASISMVVVTVPRNTNIWNLAIHGSDGPLPVSGMSYNSDRILEGEGLRIDMSPLADMWGSMAKTQYIGAFRNIINTGTRDDYFDIKVGQSFIQTWHQQLSGTHRAANEAAWGLMRDIERIFEFESFDINAAPDGRSLQVFVDGRAFGLEDLGAGLAHFILVLANVATTRPDYLLIDEPELNLHPTLQADFLTTAASYARAGCVFSTHSMGLARALADSIYTVQQPRGGSSEVRPYEATSNLAEFLGEMSFSGFRELGFDQVLLVEGPSELKTIQQLLRHVGKDHKVVLLPLGGGSLIKPKVEDELSEILRVSTSVSAVIDSERASAGDALTSDRQGFKDSCNAVGIECLVLERRATENYFTDDAVKREKGQDYRGLGPYEKLSELEHPWSKRADNWRIARRMQPEDLDATDLGALLASL